MSETWNPEPYHIEGVTALIERPHVGLLWDPGMGKTSTTLTAIAHMRRLGAVKRVVVVVPIRPMYLAWPKEIAKWDHVNHLSYTILHGDKKDERLNAVSDIYLINPEGLKWLMANGGFDKIKADMLVIDESTKFKDSGSVRFKLLKPHLSRFQRRVILTGEPIPKGYEDLFGQMYIVDQGKSLGRFITHYRMQYFFQSGYGGYSWTLRQGADKEIQARIKGSVHRLGTEGHLDMPELKFNDIGIELDGESRRIYKQFENDFIAQVGEATILSPNAAAVGSKCRQVANGGVYDEFQIAHHIHDLKTQAIVDLVEELSGQPLLVAYEFKHDLERLKKVFPNAPCMTGVVGAKLTKMEADFNSGLIPVLFAHPLSVGHGLNLQEACHNVCYYGLTWDLDSYHQFYKRVWRQGQKNPWVMVHRIMALKTLDQTVAKTLLAKEGTQTAFLEAIKEGQ